jgi:hypothetical protein
MSAAPAPPPAKHRLSRRLPGRTARRRARPAWSFDGLHRVEIVAPDPECAALLLEYASPVLPAQLVAGAPTIVRLEPLPSDPGWVIEILAVVERWLEAVPLPCARLFYGGRSYLIRSSTHVAQLVAATGPTAAAIR